MYHQTRIEEQLELFQMQPVDLEASSICSNPDPTVQLGSGLEQRLEQIQHWTTVEERSEIIKARMKAGKPLALDQDWKGGMAYPDQE